VASFALTPVLAFLIGILPAYAAEPDDSQTITQTEREFFETKIRPVLRKSCYECHSHEADSISADYTLDSAEGLRAGGATGKASVVPGKPEESLLLSALRYDTHELQMPPSEKLPDRVIQDFERWIAMGAPDPRSEDPQQLKKQAQTEATEKLWSLQSPRSPQVPDVEDKQWPRTEIDRFVLSRLEAQQLHPVDDADPRKLIRRIYFDLIGLPPAPDVVEKFAEHPSPGAYQQIVEELLASPRFGERWGRHWLDLARYAESSGMEFNFTYPHAWPYRDYVIDSFNKDKPYDQFLTEQLAGDLLPAESEEERQENLLATGFLSVGPKRHNAGTTDFRRDIVDDQIRAMSEAFLGLTVGCARCHDHKFDPIPTSDYYALAGIFLSTKTLLGTTKIKYSRHPSDLIPFGPDAEKRHQKYEAYQKQLKENEKQLADKKEELKKLTEKEKAKGKDNQKEKQKDNENSKEKVTATKEAVAALEKKIKALKKDAPEPPLYGMGVTEGEPADIHVAVGGDPGQKGDAVPRGFLTAIPVDDAPKVDSDSSGRLQLARWVTSRQNPLTARVFVNRVWHHLFGRGLVASVNNFGTLGERPSHPELLDYLAVRFMDEDWSMKQLIRSLVLSRTYQLSTQKDAANFEKDPENVYLWRMRPRRLEVEPLRDAILAVSGQLNLERPHGSSVTALGQQLARGVSWDKLNPPNDHRSVYLPVVRHYTSHMFQDFDFAASSLVVGDRAETTTSQQALFFLNNEFILNQAEAAARQLMQDAPDNPERQIAFAYRKTLSRRPTPTETAIAEQFLERAAKAFQEHDNETTEPRIQALASFMQTLFGSAEFRYLLHAPTRNDSKQPNLTKAKTP
jgi:hypothetical protein